MWFKMVERFIIEKALYNERNAVYSSKGGL